MSAHNVYAAIDNAQFDVVPVYIDERGRWWRLETFADNIEIEAAEQLLPVLGAGGFRAMESGGVVKPDVILPILHGRGGEDGSVQGLAELLHIPIVGCGVASSALCLDKDLTKHLLIGMGISVVPHKSVMRYERPPQYSNLVPRLSKTMFVKPARQGSSVGISKVTSDIELQNALHTAFAYDDKVIIEKAIVGRELEVAMLGNPPLVEASDVGEIKTDQPFYDYDTKYGQGSTAEVIVPAKLSHDMSEAVRMLALQVFEVLDCAGLARVDFFVDRHDKIYVSEVNTMPGFTNISMYSKLWLHVGVTYPKLIEHLINLALHKATAT
jgi:D-alanine-D-alanine ligase